MGERSSLMMIRNFSFHFLVFTHRIFELFPFLWEIGFGSPFPLGFRVVFSFFCGLLDSPSPCVIAAGLVVPPFPPNRYLGFGPQHFLSGSRCRPFTSSLLSVEVVLSSLTILVGSNFPFCYCSFLSVSIDPFIVEGPFFCWE